MARERRSDDATRAWTTTRVDTVRLSFTWTVEEFSTLLKQKKALKGIRSANFFSDNDDDTQWYLDIFPSGRDDDDDSDHISLYLTLDSATQPEVAASYRLSLMTANGSESHTFREDARFTEGDTRGKDHFIARGYLLEKNKQLLPGDALTIQCDISASRVSHASRQRHKLPVANDGGLSRDLSTLLGDLRFSDVTLYVKGREFAAHRVILAARSPVLASLLDGDSSERRTSRLNIKDVDADVFQQALKFIYTGRVDNLDATAAPLLAVADKYAMAGLKTLCETSLIHSMMPANVGSLYMLADVHSAEQLKAEAVKLIGKQGGLVSMVTPKH